jgi:hypothetical protein
MDVKKRIVRKSVVTACKLNDVNQIINHGSETVEKGEVKSVIAKTHLPTLLRIPRSPRLAFFVSRQIACT